MMREAVPSSAITPITHIAASLAVAFIIYLALGQPTGQAGASAGGFISFITALLMVISPVKQLTTINTTLGLIIQGAGAGLCGLVVTIVVLYLLKNPELAEAFAAFTRYFKDVPEVALEATDVSG